MGLLDWLRSAGEQDDMFPGAKGYDAKDGLLGVIRQMGRDIEELDIDMSHRAIDRGALNQLLKDGMISRGEHKALMSRLHR